MQLVNPIGNERENILKDIKNKCFLHATFLKANTKAEEKEWNSWSEGDWVI